MTRQRPWRFLLLNLLILMGTQTLSVALSADVSPPNPFCPVMTDEKSDPKISWKYQGKEVYFCCGKCVRKFKAEPEKYLHNLPQFQGDTATVAGKSGEPPATLKAGEAHEEDEHKGDTDEEESGPKTFAEFIGHLHLVAVHFPVALVLVAALFEVLGLLAFRESLAGATRAILWVASLCSVCTATTGWILASFESYNAALGEILTFHRWGGVSLAVLLLVTLVFREKAECGGGTRWKLAYRVGLLAAAVLTVLVAHWGGQLVHGPEFLELPS